MFTIIQRKNLIPKTTLIEVFSPRIAGEILPGQYVTVKPTNKSEEIVLPVSGYNPESGTISLLVQVVDETTEQLAHNSAISVLSDLKGPLGKPSALAECNDRELIHSKMLFVAGDGGAAQVLAQLTWLHNIGCAADVIISAKTKNELLFSGDFEKVSRNVYLATADGSVGFHGSETQLLELLLDKDANGYDLVTSVGSLKSMKAVSDITLSRGISAIANFLLLLKENASQQISFKLNVGGEIKDVATDGPEFNAHLVNFEQAISRQNISLKPVQEVVEGTNQHKKVHELSNPKTDKAVQKQA